MVERYQQSLKREVNQLPYELPSQLERAIADFVDYYNYHRYHKALGNIMPADVLYGRRDEILERRKKVKIQTINRRRDYNQVRPHSSLGYRPPAPETRMPIALT